MCPTCFPQPGLPADASLSSSGSSRASSPASTVLSKRYDFLPGYRFRPFSSLNGRRPQLLPAALRCLRLAVPPAFTRSVRSTADECTVGAWSWSPGISGRDIAEETTGPPKFLENPNCPFAHDPIRLRQDCGHQTITVSQRGPWYAKSKGSRKRSFEAQ